MMRIKRGTKWFVLSKDAHTNEVVAEALLGLNSMETFSTVECQDGEKRQLVEVTDYNFAARLWRSRTTLKLDFVIYRSQNDGKPDLWQFPEPRKRTTREKLEAKGVVRYAESGSNKPLTLRKATEF